MKMLLASLTIIFSVAAAQEWVFDPPECFGVGRPNYISFLTGPITDMITVMGNWEAASPLEAFGGIGFATDDPVGDPAILTYSYTYNSRGLYVPTFIAITNGMEYQANVGSGWMVGDDSCQVLDAPIIERKQPLEWVLGYGACGGGVGQLNRIALVVSDPSQSVTVNGLWDDGNATVSEEHPPRNERYTLYYEHTYTENDIYSPYFVASVDGRDYEAELYTPWNMMGGGCGRENFEIPSSTRTIFLLAMSFWSIVAAVLLLL